MFRSAISRLNPQVSITAVLSAVLALSLACSMSLQQGHADVPIADSAEETQPLQTGDPAPRFEVRTVDDEAFVFEPGNLERPAVVITFRGGWCPFCNMHLSELKDVVPQISALGVDVLFLSGDRPDQLYSTLSREAQQDIAGLDYTILSDADVQAAVAFGIAFRSSQATLDWLQQKDRDIEGSSMQRHGVLPVPSVFAIGRDGVIAFSHSDPNYRVRLPADELLRVAREIVQ